MCHAITRIRQSRVYGAAIATIDSQGLRNCFDIKNASGLAFLDRTSGSLTTLARLVAGPVCWVAHGTLSGFSSPSINDRRVSDAFSRTHRRRRWFLAHAEPQRGTASPKQWFRYEPILFNTSYFTTHPRGSFGPSKKLGSGSGSSHAQCSIDQAAVPHGGFTPSSHCTKKSCACARRRAPPAP